METFPAPVEQDSRRAKFKSHLSWFFLGNPETNEDFRDEVTSACVRGIRVSCWLAAIVLLFYLGDALVFDGRNPTLLQGLDENVSILDKLVMLVLIGMVYCSVYSQFGRNHARLILAVGVVLAGIATVADDFMNQNTEFSNGWVALILILAIGTMPYRALHAAILGIAMWCIYPLVLTVGPFLSGMPELPVADTPRLFMGIIVIIGVGISGTLYSNRFRSFKDRENLRVAHGQIQAQAERLQELDRMKARFFANLSHEFRTPLTLIQGPVEDALHGHSGPISYRLSQHLQIARRNGNRLKRLIDQLLDLSRLEDGKMELNDGMYDLVLFVRSLVFTFASLAETRAIQLTFDANADRLDMAFDSDKLEKVVTNLISNALKFTPEHGKVHVSIRTAEDRVDISVKDTGPGIPADQASVVFERFFQMKDVDSDVQAGTGIGLAIVRELTELHGGSVELTSEPGFGSTFRVSLPIRKLDMESVTPAETGVETEYDDVDILEEEGEGVPAVDESAPLILLADDHDDVRTYLRGHLENNYRIAEAKNGLEVFERLKEELPALVLSDVMMPGMDGHEVCRAIKADPKTSHIPVVLVTARASDESKYEGLRSGADDYLFKPFNATDLLARVENLIEIRRVLREHYSADYSLDPSDISVKSADALYLERLQEIVEEHIGDSNFGVDWLASEIGISTRQLQRRIRAYLGLSAAGFIRTLRLKRAVQLLRARAGSVSEIAYQVGFTDPNYFSRLFKQTFGATPTEYISETPD